MLDCEVAESFLGLSSRQREGLIPIFRGLAADPFVKSDQVFGDSSFREIQKRRFERWMITFWADHAVKEVRVAGVQRVAH